MLALGGLGGCAGLQSALFPASERTAVSAKQDRASQILIEANRLADRVKNGELTRLQAADQLNLVRLRLVGANQVDDSTFASYRYLAKQRDLGLLTQEQSHAKLETRLRDWQQRWPRMSKRPADPAFTNFLLRLYDLPPLGQ